MDKSEEINSATIIYAMRVRYDRSMKVVTTVINTRTKHSAEANAQATVPNTNRPHTVSPKVTQKGNLA